MLRVTYDRGGETEVFGPFVDNNSVKQFTLEMGGRPKIWVDPHSSVGLQYDNGEWQTRVV